MTKQQKLEYIETACKQLQDAPNHGNQGNSWWYPSEWRVAYNVKMSEYFDTDRLRKHMSKAQNEYYNDDDTLYECIWYDLLEQEWDCLKDTLMQYDHVSEVYQAGRSGGWCEVQYDSINDAEIIDDSYTMSEVTEVYHAIKALEKTENSVRETIERMHKAFNEYVASDQFYIDSVEQLVPDSEIKEIYTSQAEAYAAKAEALA